MIALVEGGMGQFEGLQSHEIRSKTAITSRHPPSLTFAVYHSPTLPVRHVVLPSLIPEKFIFPPLPCFPCQQKLLPIKFKRQFVFYSISIINLEQKLGK